MKWALMDMYEVGNHTQLLGLSDGAVPEVLGVDRGGMGIGDRRTDTRRELRIRGTNS